MWSYVIDGILIVLLVVSIIVGIAKGLVDSILSLVSTGIALLGAAFLSKHVANFVNKIFNFEDFVLKHLDGAEEGSMKIFGVIELNNVEVAKFAAWIATAVIVFILIKLVIYILAKMFESVIKNSPTVSGINRVLGMIFGALKGGVMVIVGLALCTLVCQLPFIGTPTYNAIQNTIITKPIYNFVEDFVENNLTQDKIEDIIDKIISDNQVPEDDNGTENGEDGGNNGSALATNR